MNVFLGDDITLVNEATGDVSTFISGQIKGIVLDEGKKVERVYIHGLDEALYMSRGWKFVEEVEHDHDTDE